MEVNETLKSAEATNANGGVIYVTIISWIKDLFGGIFQILKLLSRNRVGFLGFLMVVFFILFSYIGPYFIPLDTSADIGMIYHPPSLAHPLGTDHQGRDIFSQIVHGGRELLTVAFIAAAISTFIAITFGSLTAFAGGLFDSLIMSVTDLFLTIPRFPLLLVLAGFIKLNNPIFLSLLLGLLAWPTLLRAVRAQVLSLKQRDYVEAARALDLGTAHILFAEVLPNMMTYIIISFTLAVTYAIYDQVGLVLLGLVPLATNNWGVMINLAWVRGAIFFKDSLWYILSPVAMIALFQLSLVSLTRSLEEVFNPRLRGSH